MHVLLLNSGSLCLFNEFVQANIPFLLNIRLLVAVYVIMRKESILAYFSEFSLKAESPFFAVVVKKRECDMIK